MIHPIRLSHLFLFFRLYFLPVSSALLTSCRVKRKPPSARKQVQMWLLTCFLMQRNATKSQFYCYVASGGTIVIYPGTESTDLIVISRVAILFCAAIVCAMDWPAGKGLSKG
jgi:hypothetical protein